MYEDLGEVGSNFWKMSKREQNKFLDYAMQEMIDGNGSNILFGIVTILYVNLDKKQQQKVLLKFFEVYDKGFKYQSIGESLDSFIDIAVKCFIEKYKLKPIKETELFYQEIEKEKGLIDKLYKEEIQLRRDLCEKVKEINNKMNNICSLNRNIVKFFLKKKII